MHVMVSLCQRTREVILSGSIEHSNSAWVTKQTEKSVDETAGREE
jgi:hypothetical protein